MEDKQFNRINAELPDASRQKKTELICTDFFFVANSCGYSAKATPVCYSRAEVDYYMIYVTENLLEITVGENVKSLYPGNLLILPPSERYECKAVGGAGFYWLHFTGSHVEILMANCDLHPLVVYNVSKQEEFAAHFHKLFQAFEQFLRDKDTVLLDTLAPAHFLHMLADLRSGSRVTDRVYFTNDNIWGALRYLRSNYNRPISMEKLAAMYNLSPSYFRTVFKKHTGSSPIDYLVSLRVNSAAQMLLASVLSVQEISEMCGFQSQAYFSRVFRQKLGVTPSEYRRIGYANRKDVQMRDA